MVSRPAWSGHLKLSLVTCPVALYKATEDAKKAVRFNLINPETNNRVRMKPVDEAVAAPPAPAPLAPVGRSGRRAPVPSTPPAAPELVRSELVKGYQVDKGLYVTVTDDELRAIKLESNGAIQIERFVPEAEIDRLYWGAPYYLVPDGDLAQEPFAVIREAMREGGQVALARVVMHGRERQFALEPRGRGIVAHMIRTHQEVRPAEAVFGQIPEKTPDKNMVAIAKQILQQHAGPFDPSSFVDPYQVEVMALIERKKAEQGLTRQGQGARNAAPHEAEIVDLMDALKRSLAGNPVTEAKPRRPTKAREERGRPAASAASLKPRRSA